MLSWIPASLRGGASDSIFTTTSAPDPVPSITEPTTELNAVRHDEEGGDYTPKASVQQTNDIVPTFSLTEDSPDYDEHVSDSGKATQQAPKTTTPTNSSRLNVMMPPPPPPALSHRQEPQKPAQSSLRIPSNGPLPNRGPPVNSQQRAGTSGSRGKVLLAPGHSPMDWASLAKSKNLSGVPGFQRVTPAQMKQMNGRKGKPIWSSWQGKVYNITPYLPFHPGGENELMKAAGRDGTKLFMDIHPWVNWEGMLTACLVGVLVSEHEDSTLESLD